MVDIMLNAGQQAAVDAILSGGNVFVTGEGGTGKSVAIKKAVNLLRSRGRKTVVCAPTGIAAQNIKGSTIHSAFRFDLAPKVADELDKIAPSKVIEAADVVVIDEIGMVRRDLMDAIAVVVERENDFRRSTNKSPLQLVVVGDFSQLPPVVTEKDRPALVDFYGEETLHSNFYAFEADGWKRMRFKTCQLDEPMRQSDPSFVRMLNLARIGDSTCIPYFNSLVRDDAHDEAISLVPTNRAAELTNAERLKSLDGEERRFEGIVSGKFKTSDMAAPSALVLKPGARCMCLANDKTAGYINGSTGSVEAFDVVDGEGRSCVKVRLDNGTSVLVHKNTWENIEYRVVTRKKNGAEKKVLEQEIVGTFEQYPLKLAWSITYHKSQGQTIENVVIDPSTFAPGQLYVGLSRATSAAGVWLTRPIEEPDLLADPKVVDFYREIGWNPPDAAKGDEKPVLSAKPARQTEADESGSKPTKNRTATEKESSEDEKPPSFRPIENLTLAEITEELHVLLKEHRSWVRVYDLISHVHAEKLYRPDYRSFSAWLKAEAQREGVAESLLWHRKSAGDFYNKWAARQENAPSLAEGSRLSEENLNLVRKIYAKDPERGDELMREIVENGLSTKMLRHEWRNLRPKDVASELPDNKQKQGKKLCKIIQKNAANGRGSVSIDFPDKAAQAVIMAAIEKAAAELAERGYEIR